jgi:hypothetical protein
MAEGRWQKKEKTSGKKGVIKADLVSLEFLMLLRFGLLSFSYYVYRCYPSITRANNIYTDAHCNLRTNLAKNPEISQ